MPLFYGSERVGDLFVGGRRIERAYLGSTLVYQPDAGFLDEFNRTDLGPNWSVQSQSPVTVTPGRVCANSMAYMWWARQYPEDNVRVSVTVDDISLLYILTNADAADISTASSYMRAGWVEDGSLIVTALRLGQEVYREEVYVKKPEPGDVLTLQRQGNTVRVMINGTFVAGGSPSLPLPEGDGHRHINVSLTGCITRFEATDVGPVVHPRREVRHFTSSGSFTTDLPEWTRHVRALAWGGGGGGHGGDGAISRNGRGGSAGTAAVLNFDGRNIPLTDFPVTVGAGGAGGAKEKSGSSGGTTYPNGMTPVPGGAGGSTYSSSSSSGDDAGNLTLRDETVIYGGSGGSTNNAGSAPGGGGGGGAGGLFGSARSGGRGGDGRVTLDIVDQAWIDAYGTGE